MPDDVSISGIGETELPILKRSRKKLLTRLVLLGVVPLIAIVFAVGYWMYSARYVSTENAYVKTNIAKLAAEVSGRAITVNAHAHLKVRKGDVLVQIDPRPFEIAVEQAQADLDAARQEIETLAATLKEARIELKDAQDRAAYFRKRFERQIQLTKQGITSATRSDELENDANAAADHVTLVRQKIQRVKAALGGNDQQPIDKHPLVRVKIAALEQARLDLENTTIKSPVNGTVVTVPLLPGEQITAAEPLFAIVSDTAPWVDANYKETELTHVSVGQKATVVLDIYPDYTWQAEVQSISPATGAEFAILPPQNASGNWVKVVQRLPVRLKLSPSPEAPALRAGMTATATVDTGQKRTLADLLGGIQAMAKSLQ
ncbi:HlyD family secretion protein [Thalassospiraceae bacterium LMO-JJ14]|nr:HlyD family secretion protein [Thalassospiraceae bacterium LMO-JJ14]